MKPVKFLMYRFSFQLLLFIFCAWIGGLLWFFSTLPTGSKQPFEKTDAIVVLTGGENRIEAGLQLIHSHLARKLLISGVYPQTTLENIFQASSFSSKQLNLDAIDLDYKSDNTIENAHQAAKWIRAHNFRSIRLVTAHYHIQRSLLEFSQQIPEVKIIPHPIIPKTFQKKGWFWDLDSVSILWREYHKYIVSLIRYSLQLGLSSFNIAEKQHDKIIS
jgi:uncharacterized SAM-binding protein YcdF (DUF218 family)